MSKRNEGIEAVTSLEKMEEELEETITFTGEINITIYAATN